MPIARRRRACETLGLTCRRHVDRVSARRLAQKLWCSDAIFVVVLASPRPFSAWVRAFWDGWPHLTRRRRDWTRNSAGGYGAHLSVSMRIAVNGKRNFCRCLKSVFGTAPPERPNASNACWYRRVLKTEELFSFRHYTRSRRRGTPEYDGY